MGHDVRMLRVAIRHVHPDQLDDLRGWFAEVAGSRRAEALATLKEEGCQHEKAILIEGKDGPVLIYLMEVEDEERSMRAAATSHHPIDADHRAVMQRTVGDPLSCETLLDLRP